MARIVITRPNGETEYAELTTDKSLVGSHYLTVEATGKSGMCRNLYGSIHLTIHGKMRLKWLFHTLENTD